MEVKRKQVPTYLKKRKKQNRDQRYMHAYALLFSKEERAKNIPGFLCLQPQAKELAT